MQKKTKGGMNFINAMRRNRGLLQKQLAALLGIRSGGCISNYESGAAFPPLRTAIMLEIALGIRLADLYPEVYRECKAVVLKRAQDLPFPAHRAIVGRLLNEDLPHEHTRTG